VRQQGLDAVDDPTNVDPTVARSRLRSDVVPVLEAIRSGFRSSAARSMDLLGEAADVLAEVAVADLAACTAGAPAGLLRLDRLAALSPARRQLVVRRWLEAAGAPVPSRARGREIIAQALSARADARVAVRLGEHEVRRHRQYLLVQSRNGAPDDPQHLAFTWRGEPEVALPGWGGVLRFTPVTDGPGVPAAWLAEAPLSVRPRTGGERLKPHALRPSRTLKRLFQDAGVPEFRRAGLPLLWRADELVFVAGLGSDVRLLDDDGARVTVAFEADAPLIALQLAEAPAPAPRARRGTAGRGKVAAAATAASAASKAGASSRRPTRSARGPAD
jgi:tRNA(Ile)-lysidine synthase